MIICGVTFKGLTSTIFRQVGVINPRLLAHPQRGQTMIRRLFVFLLLSAIVIGGSASVRPTKSANPEPCAQDHEVWLAHLMEKMETIKPGMTRWDVLKVFRAEGGLPAPTPTPTGLQRGRFVSQDCPIFKIDVEFKPVARANLGYNLSGFLTEDNRDVIVKVSKPYVQSTATN